MRLKKLVAVMITAVFISGCVSKTEFNAYKQGINEDGTAVDAWIADAHAYIQWIHNNMGAICPECSPPNPPPDPPPDGEWGE